MLNTGWYTRTCGGLFPGRLVEENWIEGVGCASRDGYLGPLEDFPFFTGLAGWILLVNQPLMLGSMVWSSRIPAFLKNSGKLFATVMKFVP